MLDLQAQNQVLFEGHQQNLLIPGKMQMELFPTTFTKKLKELGKIHLI